MRVMVTGANGFIGRNLVENLSYNNQVLAVVRERSVIHDELKKENVKIIECNMNNYDKLTNLLANEPVIDIVYHLAWDSSNGIKKIDYNTQLENINNSCKLLEAANKLKIKRFLYAGTIAEYEYINTIENNFYNVNLNCIYSIAKMSARFMLMTLSSNYNIDFLPITISNVYGRGEESGRFFISVLNKMLKNEDIDLTEATQLHDFIYVTDAVEAISLVGEKGEKNKNYYIGNKRPRILKEFLNEMKMITASTSTLNFGGIKYSNVPIDYSQFDMEVLYKDFNFEPLVSFENGVKKIIKMEE